MARTTPRAPGAPGAPGIPGALRTVLLVAGRELRGALRDRQALLYTVVLPLGLYPLLFWVMIQGYTVVQGRSEATEVRVAVSGAPADRQAGILDALASEEAGAGALVTELVTGLVTGTAPAEKDAEPLDAARAGELLRAEGDAPDAVLALGGPEGPRLYYDGSVGRSSLARDRALARLELHAEALRARAAEERGVDLASLDAFRIRTENLASERDMGGYILSFLLPMMLVIMAVMGAFIPAVDSTAGEKERGTAETTLLSPTPRLALHLGKLLAVAAASLVATLLNLAGMAVAAKHLLAMLPGEGLAVTIPVTELVAFAPFAVLFVLFCSAVMIAAASTAESFKQGQSLLGGVQMVFMVPGMAAIMPGLTLGPGLALVPILQVVLLFKGVLQEGPGALIGLEPALVALSLVLYTALAIGAAARLMSREEIVSSSGGLGLGRALRLIGGRGASA